VAPTPDIIVIGGGAVGAACARELAVTGRRVLVLEPGTALGQAWRAAAGMLAPQIEADASDRLLSFGLRARDHYDGLAAELRETTGIDLALWREGIARVAMNQSEAELLQRKVAWQREQGHPCEWLEPPELRDRWPWLGPCVGALWAPQDGALDPEQLVEGLLSDARRRGTTVVTDRAVAVEHAGGRIVGVFGERGHYTATGVVVAAGAWSAQIGGLPRRLPIQPVKGQMAALKWPPAMTRAIVYHNDSYLLARGAEAILGSTMEYTGFQPEVTAEGIARIFSSTMALCPALARSKIQRTWAGLRPVTADGMPILGEDPELRGLWYATGHGRNGILLAGLTGRLVAQLVGGEAPELDIGPLAPERFPATD
jgi:glycine oxidase